MKRMWQEVGKKKRVIVTALGSGIHTGLPPEEIPQGMATDMYNLHSRAFPHLAPRPPRNYSALPPLPQGTLRYFGVCLGNELATVIGTTLYLYEDGEWHSHGTLFTNDTGRVYAVDFMDHAVFADGRECMKFDGTSIKKVGTSGKPTNALFLASHAWHLFTSSDADNYLCYSAVENMDDWTAPGDAGKELIETKRLAFGSALYAFGGHILYFKEDAIFELYGTDPINFSLLPISGDTGCISQESIQEIDGVLYFMGRDGVYRYTGGAAPGRISFPIQKYIENMPQDAKPVGGSDGVRYYLSLPQKKGVYVLLVYDTHQKIWHVEDEVPFFSFARTKDAFYAVTTDGYCFSFNDKNVSEEVIWSYTSRPYLCENSLFQNWHRMFIRTSREINSSCTVSLSPWLSGDGFTPVGKITKSGITQIELPSRFYDAPHLRFRLSGMGNITVSAVEFELRGRERSYY